jgi:hypothetical protein
MLPYADALMQQTGGYIRNFISRIVFAIFITLDWWTGIELHANKDG